MSEFEILVQRIVDRVNINLRRHKFDVGPFAQGAVPVEKISKFYAFYGLTQHHPVHFHFTGSALAGSYFLGKCNVDHSVLYKTDVRGDELKPEGAELDCHGVKIPVHQAEEISIKNSLMVKTLVHNYSHDPEIPELFPISNCICMHFSNVHGAPSRGSYYGPFSTVDLTTVLNSIIGAYSYVQTGQLLGANIEPGQIWVSSPEAGFDFKYCYSRDVLSRYVEHKPGQPPTGIFMEFLDEREKDFQGAFELAPFQFPLEVPRGASLSNYAVVLGKTSLDENVLVAQRAYIQDSTLGKGANAQENCYIINSQLAGQNVTAHGGKIICSRMGKKVFVGFNSFLRGSKDTPLIVGDGCIIMPHTIIDLAEPVEIPAGRLVWGYIRDKRDLELCSMSLDNVKQVEGTLSLGAMRFEGSGASFVHAFQHRIEHILEANGAYFDGETNRGHAQDHDRVMFNIIQPYAEGPSQGMYPTMDIRP